MNFGVLLLAISWARSVFIFFRRLGTLGLFLLGIGDSSFLFLPLGNDLLLIALVSGRRDSWHWIIYACAASLGSLVGVMLLDLVMRKAGEEGLERFVGPQRLEKLKHKTEKHCVRVVFITALLPPPFPFTALMAAASALQCARQKMLMAVFAGRLVRFTIESVLALYFGRRLLRYLRSDVIEYFVYGLIVVAIIGSVLTIRKWFRTRPGRAALAN